MLHPRYPPRIRDVESRSSDRGYTMLEKTKKLYGYTVKAEDGDAGEVVSMLFDDRDWNINYLIVDTGSWLAGRRVLLSTEAVKMVSWKNDLVVTNLTTKKIKDSPTVDLDKPVSEEELAELHRYYGWASFRPGILPGAPVAVPGAAMPISQTMEYKITDESRGEELPQEEIERHLRSTREVSRYRVDAEEETIGYVEDLLFDTDDWTIRYFIVDAGGIMEQDMILLSRDWVRSLDWLKRKIDMAVTIQAVKDAPEFGRGKSYRKEDERVLYEHFGKDLYW